MTDLHTQILPQMDDGAADVAQHHIRHSWLRLLVREADGGH